MSEETEIVESESAAAEVPVIAQTRFRHTPFRECAYEYVGERITHGDFAPLECPVVGDSRIISGDFNLAEFSLIGDTPDQSGGSDERDEETADGEEPVISQRSMEEALTERYEDGHLAGYEAGAQATRSEVDTQIAQLKEQFATFQQELCAQLEEFKAQSEQGALHLALSVAKKILCTTAEVRPEYIIDVIREGLKHVGAATPLKIRVSPQDHEFIQVIGTPPELSPHELGVQYVLDEGIRSGCVIETDFGDVDLQLEKMWEQVGAQLYGVVKS